MKSWKSVFAVLFLFASIPFASPASEADLSYSRRLVREGGNWFYVVGPRAPHLYMISRDLYGSESRWRDLARWNDLKEPYQLQSGQRLLLKEAPTTTVEQGNFILSEAWEARGESERARRIRVSLSQDSSMVTKAETESRAALKTEVRMVEAAPPPPPAIPAPAPLPEEEHFLPPPAPLPEAPAPVVSPKPDLHEAPPREGPVMIPPEPARKAAHSSWHFGVKALATMTEIYEQDRVTKTRQTLRTQVDPGVELEAEWRFGQRTSLLLGGGYETLEIHPPHDLEIEHKDLGLTRFFLGLAYQVNSWIDLSIAGASEQMGFFEATAHGGRMERADIPQLILGSRWLLKDGPRTKIHVNFQIMALLPAQALGEDLETGFGSGLGLQFSHPFTTGSVNYGLFARVSEQNAESFDKQQSSAGFHLGWAW